MYNAVDVAKYMVQEYKQKFYRSLDELKLHKLLYLLYREYIIEYNAKLFDEDFYGWKFGPVLKSVREKYKKDSMSSNLETELNDDIKELINNILDKYGKKSSWSLSRLTHGEISWKNARIDIEEGENGDNPMKYEDIVTDAENMKERRKKYF